MSTLVSTEDVAKAVRAELRAAFPGVKFSVRYSTGTASAWMNVSWADGPTTRQVGDITGRFEGRKFNGMTDSYYHQGSGLVAGEGVAMPEEFVYGHYGINTARTFSAAGHLEAQRVIETDSSIPHVRVCDEDGNLLRRAGNLIRPGDEVQIAGHGYSDWMVVHQAVHLALCERDLTPTRTKLGPPCASPTAAPIDSTTATSTPQPPTSTSTSAKWNVKPCRAASRAGIAPAATVTPTTSTVPCLGQLEDGPLGRRDSGTVIVWMARMRSGRSRGNGDIRRLIGTLTAGPLEQIFFGDEVRSLQSCSRDQ